MNLPHIKLTSSLCSYVCHAEVNAILNTNHASAEGQVSFGLDLCNITLTSCHCQSPFFPYLDSLFSNQVSWELFYLACVLPFISQNTSYNYYTEALRDNVSLQWMRKDYHSSKSDPIWPRHIYSTHKNIFYYVDNMEDCCCLGA